MVLTYKVYIGTIAMRKNRITFRLTDALIVALEERAALESKSTCVVALNLLESGLGISSIGDTSVRITTIEKHVGANSKDVDGI